MSEWGVWMGCVGEVHASGSDSKRVGKYWGEPSYGLCSIHDCADSEGLRQPNTKHRTYKMCIACARTCVCVCVPV